MFGLFQKKYLTMSTPPVAIDNIVGEYIAERLKRKSFKKVGRTWRKEFTDYSFIVSVQSSRWNSEDTGASFTINYGVYVPSVYGLLFDMPKPMHPKEYDCILSKRLKRNIWGQIWWDIYDYTDTVKFGRKLGSEIEKQCFGFFNQINIPSDVVRVLQKEDRSPRNKLVCGILFAELGELDKAKDYFASACHGLNETDDFRVNVLTVANRCRVNL